MKLDNKRIITAGLLHAIGIFAYALGISWLLTNLDSVFNRYTPPFLSMATFLMLLIFSVAFVGLMMFGWPVILYLQNEKRAAFLLVGSITLSLAVITVIALAINVSF